MIWINGQLKSEDTMVASPMDRGLLLGDGLFETIKIKNGHPIFLTEHLCRMQVSADELDLPINRKALRQGVKDLLSMVDPETIASARITVSRGPGPRGLSPIRSDAQFPVAMITLGKNLGQRDQQKPDRLIEAPFRRSASAISSRMKTLSYIDHLHSKAHAEAHEAADCIYLNERGQVTCTTMANLFVKVEDGYLTPPLSAGILPGIVRERLLHFAPKQDVKLRVRHLRRDDLIGRVIYRTNSLIGVREAWFDAGLGMPEPKAQTKDSALHELYLAAEEEDLIR